MKTVATPHNQSSFLAENILLISHLVDPTVSWRTDDILDCSLVRLVQGPGHDDVDPQPRDHDHQHPVEDGRRGEQGHEDEPEPQEDVDLLVDDVERQDAEAVVFVDGARGSVLVKCALGHLGEDLSTNQKSVLL